MDVAELKKQLIQHEGMKLELYKCSAGKWTIGVGRNLSSRGISVETANDMLDEDIYICISELDKVLPWWPSTWAAGAAACIGVAIIVDNIWVAIAGIAVAGIAMILHEKGVI